MKKQRVTVKRWGGVSYQIDALVSDSGALAVHRGCSYLIGKSSFWSVTHVQTGYAVKTYIFSRRMAMALAVALDGLDWDFRSPKSRKIRKLKEPVRRAVSEHVSR